MTFKENFRQGLVVEIDLKNQTVLLEDGEVNPLGAGCPRLASGGPGDAAIGGRTPGWVPSGLSPPSSPNACLEPGR